MPQPRKQFADTVRDAFLAAFGEISRDAGTAPTHLDLKLRFEDGRRIHVYRVPIAEGGTGRIEVEEPPASIKDRDWFVARFPVDPTVLPNEEL